MQRRLNLSSSTAIRSATYDDESGALSVVFVSGREYTYNGVPPQLVEEFEAASSPGSFVASRLKGVY